MSEVSAGPRTPRAVSPAKGDGREVSAHSARSRRVPEGLRPLSRPAPAWTAGRGMPEDLQNFGGRSTPSQGPDPAGAPVRPRRRTRTTQKLPRQENRGTATPTRPAAGSPHGRSVPTRIPRTPGAPHRLTGPGRAGSAAPLGRSAHSSAVGAAPLRAARGRARPARAAAAPWFAASLLLQATPASPRSPAVPRRAAASCLISLSAPPLASQMVLDRGHGGRRGNALILLLGCVLTSWWSRLKVGKAVETRNLVCCSYQSKGVDLGTADPFSCSKLAQVKSCGAANILPQKWPRSGTSFSRIIVYPELEGTHRVNSWPCT